MPSHWLSCGVSIDGVCCWARKKNLPSSYWGSQVVALPVWEDKVHLFLLGTELTVGVIDDIVPSGVIGNE